MDNRHYNLTFALKDGKMLHISEAQKGLACGCCCPACGAKMVAKKGRKKMHHFAHYSSVNCEYGYETSLHLVAKEIISNARKFVIPPVYIKDHATYQTKQISPSREINIDEVRLEKKYDGFIPDIVLVSGKKELFVEIFVTHKVTDEKLAKIKKSKTSVIEIELDRYNREVDFDYLSRILLEEHYLKRWLYNTDAEEEMQKQNTSNSLEEKDVKDVEESTQKQNNIVSLDKEKGLEKPFFSENPTEIRHKLIKTDDPVVDKNGYRLRICMHCGVVKDAELFFSDISYYEQFNLGCCKMCWGEHIDWLRRQ